MLRRDFITAIVGLAATSATLRAECIAGERAESDSRFRRIVCGCEPILSPDTADAAALRSTFEEQVVGCMRDKSLRCLGVEGVGSGYGIVLVANKGFEAATERERLDKVLALYDRGVVYVESVVVFGGYDGLRATFGVCSEPAL